MFMLINSSKSFWPYSVCCMPGIVRVMYLEVAILINCTIYCSPVLGRTSLRILHSQEKHVEWINHELRDAAWTMECLNNL